MNVGVSQVGNILTSSSLTATYQWVDCNSAFAIIPGAILQDYSPLINGSYAVIINEAGCIDTSACYLVLTTGVTLIDEINLEVYPNPSNGTLFFSLGNSASAKIEIYNSLGQLIISKEVTNNQNQIDLFNQENGMYMLKITVGEMVKTKGIVLAN